MFDYFVSSRDRPGRRYIPPGTIASHHGSLPVDQCWRCWRLTEFTERAHLITRCYGGLDGPQNLALLCGICHRIMPSFEPGDEAAAKEYAFLGATTLNLPAGVESDPGWRYRIHVEACIPADPEVRPSATKAPAQGEAGAIADPR